MPRGRHRHSPPLHRLLPPSAIAGVSLVCALGPWVFTEPTVLRGLAAAAAATAIVGAVVLRHWDTQAGKRVADLTRARASDEWRYEERVAELETDLEESRELRVKLEQRLRAKRSELAALRNEHAALLRRYATAETERASALEGRRLLEIETSGPARALLPAPAAPAEETGAVAAPAGPEAAQGAETGGAAEGKSEARAVFSPRGSQLFLRAMDALARLGHEADEGDAAAKDEPEPEDTVTAESGEPGESPEPESIESGEPVRSGETQDAASRSIGPMGPSKDLSKDLSEDLSKGDSNGLSSGESEDIPKAESKIDSSTDFRTVTRTAPNGVPEYASDGEPVKVGSVEGTPAGAAENSKPEAAQEDEAQGKSEAVDGHQRAAAATSTRAALSAQQPSGHFVAPTAVAVVPPTPPRRSAVAGGFDFFGTKRGAEPAALEAVQNEDLADVVGQEALALHKAESEAQFKPADEESRAVGQVIDLTAHDETEQIDVQGLRSAVS